MEDKDKYKIIAELLTKGIRKADIFFERSAKRELVFKKYSKRLDKMALKLLASL